MSAFCGLIRLDGGPIDDRIRSVLAAKAGQKVTSQRSRRAELVRRARPFPGEADSDSCLLATRGGGLFVAKARLDNRGELAQALGLDWAELASLGDGPLLLRVLERWGPEGLARPLGAFAFAWWREEAGQLILGRDRIGHIPLFVHRREGLIAFSTRLPALLSLPDVPRELDELALGNFLALNFEAPRPSFYRGIERVANCHALLWDAAGAREMRYWTPDVTSRPSTASPADLVHQARALLDQAVANALRGVDRVAISTSGGLDSSALAATAARLGRCESIACFTVVPPTGVALPPIAQRYVDESDKVRALGRLYPGLEIRFIRPEGLHAFDEDDGQYFARTGGPLLGVVNMGWYGSLMDTVAADGYSTLLNGDLGNLGLSWPGWLSHADLWRSGRLWTLARELRLRARQTGQSLRSVVRSEFLDWVAPGPVRALLHRRGGGSVGLRAYSALSPSAVEALGFDKAWRDSGFDPAHFVAGRVAHRKFDGRKTRAFFTYDHNPLGNEMSDTHGEIFGFETRSPLADQRLLEFLLTLPETLFRRDGIERWFARQVLADRLPPEILRETRTGAQCPEWFSRLSLKREHLARDVERLEASPLASRLLDLPRMKDLVAHWPGDEVEAHRQSQEYRLLLARGVHVGRFIRWVEGGND